MDQKKETQTKETKKRKHSYLRRSLNEYHIRAGVEPSNRTTRRGTTQGEEAALENPKFPQVRVRESYETFNPKVIEAVSRNIDIPQNVGIKKNSKHLEICLAKYHMIKICDPNDFKDAEKISNQVRRDEIHVPKESMVIACSSNSESCAGQIVCALPTCSKSEVEYQASLIKKSVG